MLTQPADVPSVFPVGAKPKLYVEAKVLVGEEWTLADPTTVALVVRDPRRVLTSYTYAGGQVVRESLGLFSFRLSLPISGNWQYRWVTTGAVEDATYDFQITVRPTVLA